MMADEDSDRRCRYRDGLVPIKGVTGNDELDVRNGDQGSRDND